MQDALKFGILVYKILRTILVICSQNGYFYLGNTLKIPIKIPLFVMHLVWSIYSKLRLN